MDRSAKRKEVVVRKNVVGRIKKPRSGPEPAQITRLHSDLPLVDQLIIDITDLEIAFEKNDFKKAELCLWRLHRAQITVKLLKKTHVAKRLRDLGRKGKAERKKLAKNGDSGTSTIRERRDRLFEQVKQVLQTWRAEIRRRRKLKRDEDSGSAVENGGEKDLSVSTTTSLRNKDSSTSKVKLIDDDFSLNRRLVRPGGRQLGKVKRPRKGGKASTPKAKAPVAGKSAGRIYKKARQDGPT